MVIVEQRDREVVPVSTACAALSLSRASLYRNQRPPSATKAALTTRVRAPSPRRLSDAERQRILDTLHLPRFADQPPTEVYAALLGAGVYLASIRTMYRVLAEAGETKERRNQRRPHVHAMPSLTATAPNQVWTWDITKLATMEKGVFLMAYVIMGSPPSPPAPPGPAPPWEEAPPVAAEPPLDAFSQPKKIVNEAQSIARWSMSIRTSWPRQCGGVAARPGQPDHERLAPQGQAHLVAPGSRSVPGAHPCALRTHCSRKYALRPPAGTSCKSAAHCWSSFCVAGDVSQ